MWLVSCLLFIIAGATDFFDGYYARLYHQETEFGKVLDPVADKILIFSTLLALYGFSKQSLVPFWFIFLIVSKDFVLLLGAYFLIVRKKYAVLSPSLLSKFVTASLMLFAIYLMLIHYGVMSIDYVDRSIQFFSICTVLIMVDYSYKFIKLITA